MVVSSEMHEPRPHLTGKALAIAWVHAVGRVAESSDVLHARWSSMLFCNKSNASAPLNAAVSNKDLL